MSVDSTRYCGCLPPSRMLDPRDHAPGCAYVKVYELEQQVEALTEKYNDLIMQVQAKIPNETRHETARRIIQQHENRRPIAATAQQGGEE